ncbi:MAG TPA: hypothetical protein VKT72_13940 [Candidatus Baltobacteraceae bacterium]|nr:hypothetical protein [Candidatus Baltobacteraceae bacterium]
MSGLDGWGRPRQSKPVVDAVGGVEAVREAILDMIASNGYRGAVSALSVMPEIQGGTWAYEAERDVLFSAALWSLVRDGIIVPGRPAGISSQNYADSGAFSFPMLVLTPYGRSVLGNGALDPHRSARGSSRISLRRTRISWIAAI